MALKIGAPREFAIEVGISVPGQAVKEKARVTYRHLPMSQVKALEASFGQRTQAEELRDFVVAIEGIEDAEGKPVGLDRVDELIDWAPAAPLDLYFAYLRELGEVKQKN